MSAIPAIKPAAQATYDAIIIGAGLSGMHQLHRLRQLGMTVRVFEDGDDLGGTWYWNRYPGARFDSESWRYGYSFSEELLKAWDWKEHFSPQPDNLQYLDLVAENGVRRQRRALPAQDRRGWRGQLSGVRVPVDGVRRPLHIASACRRCSSEELPPEQTSATFLPRSACRIR